MDINQYCKKHKISKRQLAEMCGLNPHILYNMTQRLISISLPAAISLMIGTNGDIQPWDLLPKDAINEIHQRIKKYRIQKEKKNTDENKDS